MQRRHFLALGGLALAGCGGGGGDGAPQAQQSVQQPVSLLRKSGDAYDSHGKETALVVFNGEVLAIKFDRPWASFAGTAIKVQRLLTGEVLATHPWDGAMGCAIVKDGVIHIYGNTDWQTTGNRIIHSTLGANFVPSAPTDVLLNNPASPFRFYNTSVCEDGDGFRMVVETTQGVFFADSTDLNTWTKRGGSFKAGEYCGCPSIHYIGGAHYLTWLSHEGEGRYVTKTAKSTDDCFTFAYGGTLLAPTAEEKLNNSDLDMIEFNGKVYGVYMDGDQLTYANLRTFIYDGTMAQMFAEFS